MTTTALTSTARMVRMRSFRQTQAGGRPGGQPPPQGAGALTVTIAPPPPPQPPQSQPQPWPRRQETCWRTERSRGPSRASARGVRSKGTTSDRRPGSRVRTSTRRSRLRTGRCDTHMRKATRRVRCTMSPSPRARSQARTPPGTAGTSRACTCRRTWTSCRRLRQTRTDWHRGPSAAKTTSSAASPAPPPPRPLPRAPPSRTCAAHRPRCSRGRGRTCRFCPPPSPAPPRRRTARRGLS
mmetsp:Transcript_32343/g.75510  ORF Transcript_32343/g.75510 Transcript_32343/m.75510 type:complete len:239 (-) Transcript_32343:409-1125(-)